MKIDVPDSVLEGLLPEILLEYIRVNWNTIQISNCLTTKIARKDAKDAKRNVKALVATFKYFTAPDEWHKVAPYEDRDA